MDVRYINPFVKAFTNVMPQLGFASVKKGNLSIKGQDLTVSGVIMIVGLVGDIKGNVMYSISLEDAKKIASTMMMGAPVDELDSMAQSAISELANMLTANAATAFAELKMSVDISTPALFRGDNMDVKMSSNKVLCIDFLIDNLTVGINIAFE